MRNIIRNVVFSVVAIFSWISLPANAQWSDMVLIERLTFGNNGEHVTAIQLKNHTWNTGCASTKNAVIVGSNPNYDTFVAVLLTANATNTPVRLNASDCHGAYSLVYEIQVIPE